MVKIWHFATFGDCFDILTDLNLHFCETKVVGVGCVCCQEGNTVVLFKLPQAYMQTYRTNRNNQIEDCYFH